MINEKEKPAVKFGETAWLAGLILLTLGVCLMSKAGFGVSMVVSPAYVLHLSLKDVLPFLTFGMASYICEGIILVIMCIVVKRFKWQYLLSFLTAFIYGIILDLWTMALGAEQYTQMHARIIAYVGGLLLSAVSIAMFFHSYLPPEVYDLFVKEIHSTYKFKQGIVKWIYDISSLVIAVTLTLCLNHNLTGISYGTLVCALVNAPLISFFGKHLKKVFSFEPAFPKLKALLSTKGDKQ